MKSLINAFLRLIKPVPTYSKDEQESRQLFRLIWELNKLPTGKMLLCYANYGEALVCWQEAIERLNDCIRLLEADMGIPASPRSDPKNIRTDYDRIDRFGKLCIKKGGKSYLTIGKDAYDALDAARKKRRDMVHDIYEIVAKENAQAMETGKMFAAGTLLDNMERIRDDRIARMSRKIEKDYAPSIKRAYKEIFDFNVSLDDRIKMIVSKS